jgi:hypothetical protein
MSEAIPPLPQYAFIALCLVKAQGQLYLYLYKLKKGTQVYEIVLGAKMAGHCLHIVPSNYNCTSMSAVFRVKGKFGVHACIFTT